MAVLSRPGAAALAALLLWMPAAAAAQMGPREEYEVKAAFLYNFMRFVDWPPSRGGDVSLTVCVPAETPIRRPLEAIVRGKRVEGRELAVRVLGPRDDPSACHSLFVAADDEPVSAGLLDRVRNTDVLTVGESAQFIANGGLVRFYLNENRVRFQIDAAGANRAGLRISSQLLSLAK